MVDNRGVLMSGFTSPDAAWKWLEEA